MPIVEFVNPADRHLLINVRREATSVLVNSALALNYDREVADRRVDRWQKLSSESG